MHKGQREESKFTGGRRLITFHSFRRFVKSTISDLGFGDYSEYFIGHSGSTYYRKTDKEKAELFKKIEPFLTYTDILMLERKGNDTKTKIDELKAINRILTQRDAMKNEVISKLSNKLTWLTKEVEGIKEQRGTRAA